MASSGVVTYSSLAWATRVAPQRTHASESKPTDTPCEPASSVQQLTYREIVAQRNEKSAHCKKPFVEAHTARSWPLPDSTKSAVVRTRSSRQVVVNSPGALIQASTVFTSALSPLEVLAHTGKNILDGSIITTEEILEGSQRAATIDRSVTFADTVEVNQSRRRLAETTAETLSKLSEQELTNMYYFQCLLRCGAFLDYVWPDNVVPFAFEEGEPTEPQWQVTQIKAKMVYDERSLSLDNARADVMFGRQVIIRAANKGGNYETDLEFLDLIVDQMASLKRQDLVKRLMRELELNRERLGRSLSQDELQRAEQDLDAALNGENFEDDKGNAMSLLALFQQANTYIQDYAPVRSPEARAAAPQTALIDASRQVRHTEIVRDTDEIAGHFLDWYETFEVISENEPIEYEPEKSESVHWQEQRNSFVNKTADSILDNALDQTNKLYRHMVDVASASQDAHERELSLQSESSSRGESLSNTQLLTMFARQYTGEQIETATNLQSKGYTLGTPRDFSTLPSPSASFTRSPATPSAFVRPQIDFAERTAEVRTQTAVIDQRLVRQYAQSIQDLGLQYPVPTKEFERVCQIAGAAFGRALVLRHAMSKSAFSTQRGTADGIHNTSLIQVGEAALGRTQFTTTQVTGTSNIKTAKDDLRKHLQTPMTESTTMMLPHLMNQQLIWEEGNPTAWHNATSRRYRLDNRDTCIERGPQSDSCSAVRVAAELLWPLASEDTVDWTFGAIDRTHNLEEQPKIHSWPGLMEAHLRAVDVWKLPDKTTNEMFSKHMTKLGSEYEMLTYAIYCARVLEHTKQNYLSLYQALGTAIKTMADFFSVGALEGWFAPPDGNIPLFALTDDQPAAEKAFEKAVLKTDGLLTYLCKTLPILQGTKEHLGMRVLLVCARVSHLTEALLLRHEYPSDRPETEVRAALRKIAFNQDPQAETSLHDTLPSLRHMFDLLCARHALVRHTSESPYRREAVAPHMGAIAVRFPNVFSSNKSLPGGYQEPHYNNTQKLQNKCASGDADNAYHLLNTPELRLLHTIVMAIPYQNQMLRDVFYTTMAAIVMHETVTYSDVLHTQCGFPIEDVRAFSSRDVWDKYCTKLYADQAQVNVTNAGDATLDKDTAVQKVRREVITTGNLLIGAVGLTTKDSLETLRKMIYEYATDDPQQNVVAVVQAQYDEHVDKIETLFSRLINRFRTDTEVVEAVYLSLSVPVYPLTPVHAYPFYAGLQPKQTEPGEVQDDIWVGEWMHTYATSVQSGPCEVPMHDFRACDANPGLADREALLRLREVVCTTQIQTQAYENVVSASVSGREGENQVGALHEMWPLDATRTYVCTKEGLKPEEASRILEQLQNTAEVFSAFQPVDKMELCVILKTDIKPQKALAALDAVLADTGLKYEENPLLNWRKSIRGRETTIESASLRHSLALCDSTETVVYNASSDAFPGITSKYMITHGITLYARSMKIMTVTVLREMGWAMLSAYGDTEYDCELVKEILSMDEPNTDDPLVRTAPFAAAVCVLASCCRSYMQMTLDDVLWESFIIQNNAVDLDDVDKAQFYANIILPRRALDSSLETWVPTLSDVLPDSADRTKLFTFLKTFDLHFPEQLVEHPLWGDILAGMRNEDELSLSGELDRAAVIQAFQNKVGELSSPLTLTGYACGLVPASETYGLKLERYREFYVDRPEQVLPGTVMKGDGPDVVKKLQSLVQQSDSNPDRGVQKLFKSLNTSTAADTDEQAHVSVEPESTAAQRRHLVAETMNVFRNGANASDTATDYVELMLTPQMSTAVDYIDVAVKKATLAEIALLAQVVPTLTQHGRGFVLTPLTEPWQFKNDLRVLQWTHFKDNARQFADATVNQLFTLLTDPSIGEDATAKVLQVATAKVLQVAMDTYWRIRVMVVHNVLIMLLRGTVQYADDKAAAEQHYKDHLGPLLEFWYLYANRCSELWQSVQEALPSSVGDLGVTVTIGTLDSNMRDAWASYEENTKIPASFAMQVAKSIHEGGGNVIENLFQVAADLKVHSVAFQELPLEGERTYQLGLKKVELLSKPSPEFAECSFLNVPRAGAKLYKVEVRVVGRRTGGNPFTSTPNEKPVLQFKFKDRDSPTYLQIINDLDEGYLVDFSDDEPLQVGAAGEVVLLPYTRSIDSEDSYEIDHFQGLTYGRYFDLARTLQHSSTDADTRPLQAKASNELREFTLKASMEVYHRSEVERLNLLASTCLERSFEDKAFGTNATMSTVVQLN